MENKKIIAVTNILLLCTCVVIVKIFDHHHKDSQITIPKYANIIERYNYEYQKCSLEDFTIALPKEVQSIVLSFFGDTFSKLE